MSDTDRSCPRCGTGISSGQEYCLSCGLRLPGGDRLGPVPVETQTSRLRLGVLALVGLVGAVVAIAATHEPSESTTVVTATGGSATIPTPAVLPTSQLVVWPRGRSGWTVVLTSIPKTRGKAGAVAIATRAVEAGLGRVGILDSSRFVSLQPGYWTVFAGVRSSEPEATDGLRRARTVVRSARTQEIVPG